jgi:hypothetical protein
MSNCLKFSSFFLRRREKSRLERAALYLEKRKAPEKGPFVFFFVCRLLFVALAALSRTGTFFGVAVFTQSMCRIFVHLNFAGFGVTVADLAIHDARVGFMVEGYIAVFGFHDNSVRSNGGPRRKGEH